MREIKVILQGHVSHPTLNEHTVINTGTSKRVDENFPLLHKAAHSN